MKKMFVAFAIVCAFIGGIFASNFVRDFKPEWDYSRGVGQTEVRADYDISIGDDVWYEILLWDKEYKNYEVVERGFCNKDELNDISEVAGVYEKVFEAGYRR